jgi:hypothetical protein
MIPTPKILTPTLRRRSQRRRPRREPALLGALKRWCRGFGWNQKCRPVMTGISFGTGLMRMAMVVTPDVKY